MLTPRGLAPPGRSAHQQPRQCQPCGCRASRGAAGAEWRSGRQGRWPLDASSRSPQTPGEQHWPLGYLISPNTPRHGPNSVVDQQLPGHWPRPPTGRGPPPSKSQAKRPANARPKRPANARPKRPATPGKPASTGVLRRAFGKTPGGRAFRVPGVPFWGWWKCGDWAGRRDDGTTAGHLLLQLTCDLRLAADGPAFFGAASSALHWLH